MSSNNPFNKGSNQPGKSGAKPESKGESSARRLQQESGGNKSSIGQRRGKPAPKPGAQRPGGSGGNATPPGIPKGRPNLPGSGTRSGGAPRRGCGLPMGTLVLLLAAGVIAVINGH